ncbi:SDR family oxidoreductase [Streptomyces sp. NPDC046985]|uniref:SDR family oxidoreductase n=1 Tax=Streptomyces sp. NPDC046985 TaxID=3155377 RepID=UPI0033DF1E0B
MKAPELLGDEVVVVSGVGSGLGRTLALRCAESGADVVLAARTSAYLDEVAKAVESTGSRALAVPTDITDPAAAEALAAAALGSFGRLHAEAHVVHPGLAQSGVRRLREQHTEETADAVIFLASHLARVVTGRCLDVDCGEYRH